MPDAGPETRLSVTGRQAVVTRCGCRLDMEVTSLCRAKCVLLKPPVCSSLHTSQSPSLPWASGAVPVPFTPQSPGPSSLQSTEHSASYYSRQGGAGQGVRSGCRRA